jgi:tetratricopeptide (TPR) repeat protein
MARFDKLEFGSEPEPVDDVPPENGQQVRAPKRKKKVERDETHWMAKANNDRRVGQYENALRFYSRALEENKSLVAGWVGQVQMLILLDECPEAETWSRKGLELFPGNGDLLAARAQAVCRMKDLSQAHVLCDGSLKQSGQNAYRWTVRGELMVVGKQDTDRHCFDKAQQMESDWLVPVEIALVYLHYRSPNKALNRIRQAVENAPDQYYPWYLRGMCQYELGLARQAEQSFQRCLELSPQHVEANRRLHELQNGGSSIGRFMRRLFSRQ